MFDVLRQRLEQVLASEHSIRGWDMGQKHFGVRFYRGDVLDSNTLISDLLQQLYTAHQNGQPYPHVSGSTVAYELRDFTSLNGGNVFTGVLAVLRDDAPNIRDDQGVERPIAMQPGDRLIEKNHFVFYKERQLLAWQVNARASHVSRFEQYLSEASGLVVGFDDIISAASFQRISQGVVKKLEVRIAAPTNPALVPATDWTTRAFQLMSGVGATSIKIDVSTRTSKGLMDGVKQVIHQLKDSSEAESIKVKLAGDAEPIDLVADSIRGKVSVNMVGLYPDPIDMFRQLQQLKDVKKGELDEFFGQGSHVLG